MKKLLLVVGAGMLFLSVTGGAVSAQETLRGGAEPEIALGERQSVSVTGVLKRQGITTYMYGSHTIRDAGTGRLYALRSKQPGLLDRYVGKRVVVRGVRVPGFPREGGPPLLEVSGVSAAPSFPCSGPPYDPTVRCPVR